MFFVVLFQISVIKIRGGFFPETCRVFFIIMILDMYC